MTRQPSLSAANTANPEADSLVLESGRTRPPISAVMRLARSLWPRKTDAELAQRTKHTMRTCRRWLSEETGISAEALVELLRSEEGFAFLEVLIDDAKPAWWRSFRLRVQLDILAEQRERINAEMRRVSKRGRS